MGFNAGFKGLINFSTWDTVHRHTVHYLTLYTVTRNQYIIFLLRTQFFNLIPLPLKLVGDRALWLSYLDSAMSKLQESP